MTVAAYRDRTSGRYPITLDEVRALAKDFLFGPEPTPEVLDAANIDPVIAVEPPVHDPSTHFLRESDPEQVDGSWRQTWAVAAIPASPLPELDDYRLAVQERVDAVAQTKRYDSGVSMASYVNSTNETWAAEAQAFVAWRDRVWAQVYALMDAVLSGELSQPTIDELIAGLPEINWPAAR